MFVGGANGVSHCRERLKQKREREKERGRDGFKDKDTDMHRNERHLTLEVQNGAKVHCTTLILHSLE